MMRNDGFPDSADSGLTIATRIEEVVAFGECFNEAWTATRLDLDRVRVRSNYCTVHG